MFASKANRKQATHVFRERLNTKVNIKYISYLIPWQAVPQTIKNSSDIVDYKE